MLINVLLSPYHMVDNTKQIRLLVQFHQAAGILQEMKIENVEQRLLQTRRFQYLPVFFQGNYVYLYRKELAFREADIYHFRPKICKGKCQYTMIIL